MAEYNGNGQITSRYIHGDRVDEPWVLFAGSSTSLANTRFLHADHQGSIIALSMSHGYVDATNSYSYDSCGIAKSTNTGRFGYTGQLYFKALDLNYYKARFYHPKLGRFLQTDPVFYEDQMNIYAYVGNDPVNMTDPTGMEMECVTNPVTGQTVCTTTYKKIGCGCTTITGSQIQSFINDYNRISGYTSFSGITLTGLSYVYNENKEETAKPNVKGKEGSKDVPSWAKGKKPYVGEKGEKFADRLLDEKYGKGKYKKGPGSEHNKIKKWGDRSFQ